MTLYLLTAQCTHIKIELFQHGKQRNSMCLDKFWAKINAILHYQCAFSIKKDHKLRIQPFYWNFAPGPYWGTEVPSMGDLQHGPGGPYMAHPKFWLAGHTACDGTNNCPVCSLILRKIGKTWCHQMSDLRAKMHQILFRWGSAPDPAGGA